MRALIPRTFARCYCFIGNGTGDGVGQPSFAAAGRHVQRSAITVAAVIWAQVAGPMPALASGDIAAANRLDANKQSSNDRTGRLGKSHSPPGASPLQTAARVSTRPPQPTECVAINAPPRHRHVRADRRVMRRQCSGGRAPRVGFADRGDCRCDCRFMLPQHNT